MLDEILYYIVLFIFSCIGAVLYLGSRYITHKIFSEDTSEDEYFFNIFSFGNKKYSSLFIYIVLMFLFLVLMTLVKGKLFGF